MTPAAPTPGEHRWELTILVGPCDQDAAEEFLLALGHKFGDHLGAAYGLRPWNDDPAAVPPSERKPA